MNQNLIHPGKTKHLEVGNKEGIQLIFSDMDTGVSVDSILFKDELIFNPSAGGPLFMRRHTSGELCWLQSDQIKLIDDKTIQLSGTARIETAKLQFQIKFSILQADALRVDYSFSIDQALPGWDIGFGFSKSLDHGWTAHFYPHAADAKSVACDPLTYVGVPSALLYRDDQSLSMLFGLDPNFDYLNPTTWTGDCGFFFTDGVVPPHYRVAGNGLSPNETYELSLQLIISKTSPTLLAVPDLVRSWIAFNDYTVEPLFTRTVDEALGLFIDGRRHTSLWHPGQGYKLEEGDPEANFIYLGEQPLSAYFEYLLFEETGNPIWRQRTFEQLDFLLQAQDTDPESVNFGVFHTAYDLGRQEFESDDRGNNVGFKPDINVYMARYLLLAWKSVKDREGIDRQDWYQAAIHAADWVLRQRNSDGGLPQVVRYPSSNLDKDVVFHKSQSATPGRALPALPIIARLTGLERFHAYAAELEDYVRDHVEGHLHYTGHHPDLPPDELEEAGIWGLIEYWLDKFELDDDREALERAVANAFMAFLWWCPKQLSWVDNPTQCASAEQQHFLQYSIYCYQNRKVGCLRRLANYTGETLFTALSNRILQGIFWTQINEGDLKGATHERIADPWLARDDYDEPPNFNSLGTIYMGEQILDSLLVELEAKRQVEYQKE